MGDFTGRREGWKMVGFSVQPKQIKLELKRFISGNDTDQKLERRSERFAQIFCYLISFSQIDQQ